MRWFNTDASGSRIPLVGDLEDDIRESGMSGLGNRSSADPPVGTSVRLLSRHPVPQRPGAANGSQGRCMPEQNETEAAPSGGPTVPTAP